MWNEKARRSGLAVLDEPLVPDRHWSNSSALTFLSRGIVLNFDFAVSVGRSCRAKHQISRLFPEAQTPSCVFDWQTTPPQAFVEYLAADFRNTFRRDDLEPGERGVTHTRLKTIHPHEFKDTSSRLAINAEYPAAWSRHEYLCNKTRGLFRGSAALLLVQSRHLTVEELATMQEAIRSYNPALRFTLLNGPDGDYRSSDSPEAWKGNDDLWSSHLAPFVVR